MPLKRQLFYALPASIRPLVRRLYYLPYDLLKKDKSKLAPPKGAIFVGSGDFEEQGKRFLKHFKEWTDLAPNHTVLDVGSGIGRMAIPLINFLNEKGTYHGFDIVPQGIDWCKKNISAKHTNFHFHLADIKNSLYNPNGKMSSTEFIFPYDDATFDFVFLTSVFTHMQPTDVAHYLSEISRVMKPNAQCFITWFILDETSRSQLKKGLSEMDFSYETGAYSLMNEKVADANIAFDHQWIINEMEKNQLSVQEPIKFGWWSKRAPAYDFQDIVVAIKTEV